MDVDDVTTRNERREAPLAERLSFPLREFIQAETSGGILLLVSALGALIWANSPWAGGYDALWATEITVGPGGYAIKETLLHWVNDGLMAVFFFVVGLEIKREVLVGELASPRQALLPVAAALGGVVVPAAIYAAFNASTAGAAGWGVPMATDIAFALGVLALLGDRVPAALKVFLTALAIVDDLVAVLVIALFYTADVSWLGLGVGAVFLVALVGANRLHVRHPLVYALLGIGLWAAFLESGIHATIAGVLLALTIPARTRIDPADFLTRGQSILAAYEQACRRQPDIRTNAEQQAAVRELEAACEAVETPLQRLEHALHPWVAYAIVPIFALANAGVPLEGSVGEAMTDRITLGVVAGLVVGKQVGITLFAWLATRNGLTALPAGIGWRHLYGASWLAGIGFTMSLFIAELGFDEASLLTSAKLGILAASLIAGVGGWLVLTRWASPPTPDPVAEKTSIDTS